MSIPAVFISFLHQLLYLMSSQECRYLSTAAQAWSNILWSLCEIWGIVTHHKINLGCLLRNLLLDEWWMLIGYFPLTGTSATIQHRCQVHLRWWKFMTFSAINSALGLGFPVYQGASALRQNRIGPKHLSILTKVQTCMAFFPSSFCVCVCDSRYSVQRNMRCP